MPKVFKKVVIGNHGMVKGLHTPRVTRPAFESGLDKISSAIGHAGPQEKLSGLGGRGGSGSKRRDGLDNGGLAGTQRNGAAPGVVAAEHARRGWDVR